MRPRKRIAVVDRNEISREIRCFVLDVWGYRAIGYRTVAHAKRLRKVHRTDMTLVVQPSASDYRALRQRGEMRVLSLDAIEGSTADVSLDCKSSVAAVREAVKILVQRKRGPKA